MNRGERTWLVPKAICLLLVGGVAALAEPPVDYYSNVDPTTPVTLRASLNAAIRDHAVIPYAVGGDNWLQMEDADEDPTDPSSVLDFYKNEIYSKVGGGSGPYNREHLWPKSFGFPLESGIGVKPFADLHHLRLVNGSYNSARNNRVFDVCNDLCARYPTTANHGVGGESGTFPSDSNWGTGVGVSGAWRVWNHRQGDAARALFYMDVRYEGAPGEPDLVLTDELSLVAASATGSNEPIAYMGILSVLLDWHDADPPDTSEQRRNDRVFLYQQNRNPFIDHPEWVDCVFLGECVAPPTGLAAVPGNGQIALDWADNAEVNLAGYNVYRAEAGGAFVSLNGVLSASSAYLDSSAANGMVYAYRVTAVTDDGLESLASGEVLARAATASQLASTISAGPMTELPTVSPLRTTPFDAEWNVDFVIQDDGASPDVDTEALRFPNLVLTPGPGNEFADWTGVLAGAMIESEGATFPGNVSSQSIAFDGLNTDTGGFGFIADNAARTYRVKVWLREDLAEPVNVDGRHLVFELNGLGVRTLPYSTSGVGSSERMDSGAANNRLDVEATRLRFVETPTLATLNTDFSATLEAVDCFGNRDRDATPTVELSLDCVSANLTAAGGLAQLLVQGIHTWGDLQLDAALETGRLVAVDQSGTLDEATSDSFSILAHPLSIDVSGYTLEQINSSQAATLPTGTEVAVGGCLVLGRQATREDFAAFWGDFPQEATYANGFALVGGSGFPVINGGEQYRLFDASNNQVEPNSDFLPPDPLGTEQFATRISTTNDLFTTATIPNVYATPGLFAGLTAGDGAVRWTEFSDTEGTGNFIYEFAELYYDALPASAGVFAFASPRFEGAETDGAVEAHIQRLGGANGTASVRVRTMTATAGTEDFDPVDVMFIFEHGERTKTISVSLADDAEIETDEVIALVLENPSAGASLGCWSTAELTILGEDQTQTIGEGNAPPRYFTRGTCATVDFNEGTQTDVRVRLERSLDNVSGIGSGARTNVASALWHVESTRAGTETILVAFDYFDEEIQGIFEHNLRLFTAPSPDGSWLPVPVQRLDPEHNRIEGEVSVLGYFILADKDALEASLDGWGDY